MTREEAIKIFREWTDEGFSYDGGYAVEELDDDGKEALEMAIKALSQEGKWILLDECANSGYYCSECQKKLVKEGWSNTVKKINFCPNCGSRMVDPQESEDKE